MKIPMFSRVALNLDLPEKNLRKGDVATVIEEHPGQAGQESGYSIEVFNAVGDTVALIVVRSSQVVPLTSNEILNARPLAEK